MSIYGLAAVGLICWLFGFACGYVIWGAGQ